jgi:hypothetical protein
MSCFSGSPCYSHGTVVYPTGCGIDPCYTHKTGTDLVFYNGANLPCVGVDTCDSVTLALQKIDQKLCPDALALAVLGSITNNLSIRNMFCALVNGCNPTTTTTTTVAPTTTTTTSSSSTTTTTTTISDDCNCYTIENDETESGVDPYFFSYIDCISGLELSTPLDFGQSDNFCGRAIGITTNFTYTLTNFGLCGLDCPPTTTTTTSSSSTTTTTSTSSTTTTTTTATPTTTTTTTTVACIEYNITNPTAGALDYSYVNCSGNFLGFSIDPDSCMSFSAQEGSVTFDLGLILAFGPCP